MGNQAPAPIKGESVITYSVLEAVNRHLNRLKVYRHLSKWSSVREDLVNFTAGQ